MNSKLESDILLQDNVLQSHNIGIIYNILRKNRLFIYTDHCDDKLIETFPPDNKFHHNYQSIAKFLNDVIPEGGGDVPEASLDGLAVALTSDWDTRPQTKRMLIIHLMHLPTETSHISRHITRTVILTIVVVVVYESVILIGRMMSGRNCEILR